MSRRSMSAALVLVCFIASVLVGLSQATKGSSDDASTLEGTLSTLRSQASGVASILCDKLSELTGSQDPMLAMVGAGAAAAAAVICTLYGLSRYFDDKPYLFNDGKMGKLEASSVYSAGKKKC